MKGFASVRAFPVRWLLGRLRIDDDILRHLSTFQRLGETAEVQPPIEMLPVGARTVLRALRTRAAAQILPDWIWPRWLEQQLNPCSPAFVPEGHLPFLANVTARNWTTVGNAWSDREAIVDPAGLVTPWFDGWSLDWWARVDGRWRFPSREDVVQRLLGGSERVITLADEHAAELGVRLSAPTPDRAPDGVEIGMQLLASGDLRLRSQQSLPMSAAAEAHRLLEEGRVHHKLLLTTSP